MTEKHVLFFGDIDNIHGGFKNPNSLLILCPEEFKNSNNLWRKTAEKVLAANPRVNMKNWNFKNEKERYVLCVLFNHLLHTKYQHSDLLSMVAWTMSEMLIGIPGRILGYDHYEGDELSSRPTDPQSGMLW